MNQDELRHYGVKGMKWGVRRARNSRARDAARLKRMSNKLDKSAAKSENKYQNNKQRIKEANRDFELGRISEKKRDRIETKNTKKANKNAINRKDLEKASEILKANRGLLIKGLSQEEIKRGEKYVAASEAIKETLYWLDPTGVISSGILGNRFAKQHDLMNNSVSNYKKRRD